MAASQAMVKKYAGALYNIAVQKEDVKEVSGQLHYMRAVLKAVPEFSQLLITRRVNAKNKLAILTNVLGDKISTLEKDLISHLLEDGHFLLFVDIIKRFEYLVETDSSVIKVRITSHRQLGQEEIQRISSKIENIIQKKIDILAETDSSIMGGIKLRVDNTLIDGSVHGRLQQIRDMLTQV